ncbi:2-phospho-L-lactate guanylyltransferase [Pilimelia terevasa]|uniref:Phosphoenolpyruvate guanylyltransferase n=1 Tax=Pilimelia terevasa TaxID=53372 RepID=A0A8J3BL18_9ACTN|nr:2-phospho-L-lactate guanylyltransferase [Pilimelia terevasa]GGK29248.1 2-phospho-L-lactate guanylyltransferase [Pilimelia terevasa]
MTAWTVWVPAKPRATAKSRLALPPARRAALVEAMLRDVLAAVAAVARPVVVTADPYWRCLGAPVRAEPAPGLNAAASAAASADSPVAVLVGDLPALRAAELASALELAAAHPWALVADAAGHGTTLLAATAPGCLRPAFGARSRLRHRAAGAADLTARLSAPGLRRDVDTLADLRAAVALGVGPATAQAWPDAPAAASGGAAASAMPAERLGPLRDVPASG